MDLTVNAIYHLGIWLREALEVPFIGMIDARTQQRVRKQSAHRCADLGCTILEYLVTVPRCSGRGKPVLLPPLLGISGHLPIMFTCYAHECPS